MNKIFLIDIDNTLLDTNRLNKNPIRFILNKNYAENLVFPDMIRFLEKKQERYDLGIISKGIPFIQIFKLKKTGLLKYFNQKNIFIVRNKIEFLQRESKLNQYEKIYIVDDQPFWENSIFKKKFTFMTSSPP